MHKFLRSIGFSKVDKEELEELLNEIKLRPDCQLSSIDSDGNQIVELRYMVDNDLGLVLRGSYNQDDLFVMDYFYPSLFSTNSSTCGDIEIIQQSENDNYYIICDEDNLGISLIFQLQNVIDYLSNSNKNKFFERKTVFLSALSNDGKVILPIYENEKIREKIKKNHLERTNLVEAARDGDEEAVQNLSLHDLDIYTKNYNKLENKDILSIVSTYFMPYGIENDKYEILGIILEVETRVNHLTMEEIYVLQLDVKNIILEVCINKQDLFGEPQVGRRFKGYIWLQGAICF